MKCAFTICSYSYWGLAKVLKESFEKYNDGYDFYIVFIDKVHKDDCSVLADDILIQYMKPEDIINMQFKYDITEYSTSVKPFSIKYFMQKGYSKVLYFDPDIKFYSEFKEVLNDKYEAYVTPHMLYNADHQNINGETSMLKYGLFNCGFIGFNASQNSLDFLNFWCDRLTNYCFNNPETGVYTDQKWIDFVTIKMFEKLNIIFNPGCNYAPWNMNERKVRIINGKKVIETLNNKEEVELVFFHFSGFNYKKLQDGKILHGFRDISYYEELESILLDYGNDLKKHDTNLYLNEKYKYNYYSNGEIISKLNRRIYNEMINTAYIENPFDVNGVFYQNMKKNKIIAKCKSEAKGNNTKNISKKKNAIFFMFHIIKKILGIDKYTEFLKAVHKYSTYESQTLILVKDIENDIKKTNKI